MADLQLTDLTMPKDTALTEADGTDVVTLANTHKWDKVMAQTVLDQRHAGVSGYVTRSAASRQADVEKVKPEALKRADGSFLTETAMADVVAYAKEQGLSLPAAQKHLDLLDGHVRGYHQRIQDDHQKRKADWAAETKADKDLGGTHEARTAKRLELLMQRFDPDKAVTTLLNETGAGRHKAVVRFFDRIGALLEEEQTVLGGLRSQEPARKSIGEDMFPAHVRQGAGA